MWYQASSRAVASVCEGSTEIMVGETASAGLCEYDGMRCRQRSKAARPFVNRRCGSRGRSGKPWCAASDGRQQPVSTRGELLERAQHAQVQDLVATNVELVPDQRKKLPRREMCRRDERREDGVSARSQGGSDRVERGCLLGRWDVV